MFNPWEWLKLLYETAGHKHPALSACGIVAIFALCGLLVWWRLDSQYRKDHPIIVAAAPLMQPPALPTLPTPKISEKQSPVPSPTGTKHHTESKLEGDPVEQRRKDDTPSRTGGITIGPNSPVSNSTINTGTIYTGPPKPRVLTTEEQQRAKQELLVAPSELRMICVGQGCQTANSLMPVFSAAGWMVHQSAIGTYSSVSVGPSGATTDSRSGVRLMEKGADPHAVAALKSALDAVGIAFKSVPWIPMGPRPPASGIILFLGIPE